MSWEDRPVAREGGFALPRPTNVVKKLLIANVVLFVLQWVVFDGWIQPAFDFMERAFALDPLQWKESFPLLPVWQLLSYGFLHGGPEHVLFNMLFLYFLGTMLEAEIGGRRFLVFYLTAIVLAGACQLVLGLALGQLAPIVGASGAVLAIVCAMATLRPGLRMIFIIVPLTLRTLALIFIALDLFRAISELKGGFSGVASFAHLSGALFGYLAVRQAWIWRDPLADLDAWRGRRAQEREVDEARQVDEVLAKIAREGIQSLTARERALLKRASQRR